VDSTPEQLRDAIGRNKVRSIFAAAAGGIAWFAGFILLAKFAGPLDRSWMLPVTAAFLVGGLCALIFPVYLLNRRFAPRCRKCRHYLWTEEIVDLGECPRCHTKLFG
jgi:hypothetical protein